VGEPPLMLAISVWEAIRDAVAAARGGAAAVAMKAPATPENVLSACGAKLAGPAPGVASAREAF
jgi:xanthine dehydrogenase large subunit